MKIKTFYLIIAIVAMSVASCGLVKEKPNNVRELMESDGWEYCGLISTDVYFDKKKYDDGSVTEAWIAEDSGNYDLFKKGEELCLTRTHTDQISLSDYDGNDEHMYSSYWINDYAIMGDYTLRADHARRGTGRLGMITKNYNAKTISKSGSTIYFVITSQSVPPHDYNSDLLNSDYESSDVEEDEPEPQEGWWNCNLCGTTGRCQLCFGLGSCGVCGGGGSLYRSSGWIDCENCGGSGRCPSCEGSGACFACHGTGRCKLEE